MKKSLIFSAVALAAALSPAPWAFRAEAQELTVDYRLTFHADSEQMKAEFEDHEKLGTKLRDFYRELTLTYRLVYKDGTSTFQIVPTEERQTTKIFGMPVDVNQFASMMSDTYVYKDHDRGIVLTKMAVMRKDIVVSDEIGSETYVLTDMTNEILGHKCRKAVSEDGETTVWVSTDFALRDEPIACGLDGLILEYDDGLINYTAVSIEEGVAADPTAPEAKTVMTRAEYDAKYSK